MTSRFYLEFQMTEKHNMITYRHTCEPLLPLNKNLNIMYDAIIVIYLPNHYSVELTISQRVPFSVYDIPP